MEYGLEEKEYLTRTKLKMSTAQWQVCVCEMDYTVYVERMEFVRTCLITLSCAMLCIYLGYWRGTRQVDWPPAVGGQELGGVSYSSAGRKKSETSRE